MSKVLKCVVCGDYTDPGVLHACQLSASGPPVQPSPHPAMPASVRELVEHCKADAHFPKALVAAVEAHYAKEVG